MSYDPPPESRRHLPVWAFVVLCLGALGAGAVVLPMLRLDAVPRVQQTPDLSAPDPDRDAPAVASDPEPDPRAPRFDLVRAAPDGRMIVAGRALPGALVEFVVDGVTLADTRSDGAGQFVAFLTLDASDVARVLSLVTRDALGTVTASAETVILAPDARAAPAQPAPGAAAASIMAEGPSAAIPAPVAAPDFAPSVTAGKVSAPDAAIPAPDNGAAADDQRSEPARAGAAGDATRPAPVAPDRVSAGPRRTALVSGADGVRVMASPPLEGAALRLDSIDYGAQGAVVLRGRAASGGTVRATLSGLPPVEIAPDSAGTWTLRLPDVPPGDYRLDIVRATHNGAPGTDRVTIPFRRAASADVAAALSGEAARIVTVQPGATLWAIARDRYGEGGRYVQVYDANRDAIRDPDLIYPGQVFRLPDAAADGPISRPADAPR